MAKAARTFETSTINLLSAAGTESVEAIAADFVHQDEGNRAAMPSGSSIAQRALRRLAPRRDVVGVTVLMPLDDPWLMPLVGATLLRADLGEVAKPDPTLSPAGQRLVAPVAGMLRRVFGGFAAPPPLPVP